MSSLLPVSTTLDPTLFDLRSLVARGRHAEADRKAHISKRRLPAEQWRDFLALRADIALGLGRFASALEWVGEALRGLDTGHRLRRVLEGSRIRALLGLGRFREAEGSLESDFAVLDQGGVDLSFFRSQVALRSGRLTSAHDHANQACTRAAAAGQRAKLVEALLVRARIARETGRVESARHDLDRARQVSNGLRDASTLASVLSDRADFMAHSGRWAEASSDASQSGKLFARAFSPHEHLTAGRRTGLLELAQGDPEVALPAIERAADVARRGFGAIDCRAEIDLLLADAQLAGRDPEGALERATAALCFFRNAQDPGGLARAHVRRSLAALSASNTALAFREARLAGAIEGAGPVAAGLADLALGRVLLRKDLSLAAVSFERASGNVSLYPPLRSVAQLGLALAQGAAAQGDTVGALASAIEAFGDRRILAIVRSDLREIFGVAPPDHQNAVPLEAADDESEAEAEFLSGLVGVSNPVRNLARLVRRAAPSDLAVLIYGETGTGKEKVARAVHDLSPRATREFVAINAASLSDELFESELFGHVRGSFTGAVMDRPGLVERAKGGTLFIDEVADLSPRSQVRLLRFVEQGVYRRVGETTERRAEVRIVTAANVRLQELVSAGRFRADLWQRLQGFLIDVPPLRDRGRDVIRLARHFVALASSCRARLSPASEAEIVSYSWPGNVRELQNEMRRAVVLSDSPIIDWHRPASGVERAETPRTAAAPLPSLHEALEGFERSVLKTALSQCAERVEVARRLGISRQALHQKLVRHGL